jgi:CheY-like chemotaxis protein
VEDSLDLRLLLESHMTKLGAEVHTACNGLEGVDHVFAAEQAGTPFDVVLLDMQMPVMDGYTAIQEIRKRGSAVYVVAITAYAMASDAERCLDLGCDLHLAKPFGFAHLRKILADRPVGHTRT